MVARGDVWLAALDPAIGSEIQKTRPCLVISPSEINAVLRTVLVAPMTTKGFVASFRVQTRFAGRDGLVALDQLRALDKGRLLRRIGPIGDKTLATVLERLAEFFAP